METTIVGYVRITGYIWGYIEIVEKKMETTTYQKAKESHVLIAYSAVI